MLKILEENLERGSMGVWLVKGILLFIAICLVSLFLGSILPKYSEGLCAVAIAFAIVSLLSVFLLVLDVGSKHPRRF